MSYFNSILSPEIYQGRVNPHEYFEGWYFKHVTKDKKHCFIVIPGVSYEKDDAHAFIQIIIGPPFKSYYFRYPIHSFSASKDRFEISIEENHFSHKHIDVTIDDDALKLNANIKYTDLCPLNRSITNPTIMGYFAYLPFLQCNHGLISLNHRLSGGIAFNGKDISFNNGSGYIEKDWGTSFPKKYIWLQCNNFDKDVTLFFSTAHVPFLSKAFIGHIAVFTVGRKQYRFATYTGSTHKVKSTAPSMLSIALEDKPYKLVITAHYKQGLVLKAPKKGIMNDTIKEMLDANVKIEFFENDTLVLESDGTNAGLEVVNYL